MQPTRPSGDNPWNPHGKAGTAVADVVPEIPLVSIR